MHAGARLLERAAGRIAVHLPERRGRQDEIARRTTGTHRLQDGKACSRGLNLVRAEVQPRADEDVPEALDRGGCLAMAPKKLAEGLGLPGRQPGQPGEQERKPNAIADGEVAIAEKRAE